jgi:hypothetical protein
MTAPTLAPSAYPTAVEDLIPPARDLADQLGKIPSRNRLMKEFKVGPDKAKAVLAAITAETTTHPGPIADLTETAVIAEPDPVLPDATEIAQVAPAAYPGTEVTAAPDEMPPPSVKAVRRPVVWPVLLLALPAFVAIWAGWVDLGGMTGFGEVNLLPGIADWAVLNTAITLPIGVETYAAYALWVWLAAKGITDEARRFAKFSAIGSLAIGALGQVAYHLMTAAGWTTAPWQITALVAALPVAVLGMGAALAHMVHSTDH